jgi:hypothetical protein
MVRGGFHICIFTASLHLFFAASLHLFFAASPHSVRKGYAFPATTLVLEATPHVSHFQRFACSLHYLSDK